MTNLNRALTVEDLTKIAVYSDPQFAPNGESYAFVSTTVNDEKEYQSQIFIQSTTTEPQQWTFGHDKNSHPRYSPDGKSIVFQSTRSGTPQIWLVPVNGGEARQITFFKHGAVNPEWSKDGNYIIFTAELNALDNVQDQKEQSKEERQHEKDQKAQEPIVIDRLKHKSDAKGFHDHKRAQLVLFNIEEKSFKQLTSNNTDHGYEDISPDGNLVLFSANLDDDADYQHTNDLFLLNISTKEVTKLTDGKGAYGNASFSPSGDKIACFGHEYAYSGATLSELFIFDAVTKERACLSESIDLQLGDVMIGDTRMGQSSAGPVWSKNEDKLYLIATDFGATGLYQADLNGNIDVLYKDNNHVFGFTYDDNTDTFILGISTPTNPCNYYLLKNSELTRLTNANAQLLDEVSLADPETITVTAEDGWEIQGWLLHPYGYEEKEKYPLILEIHGGPHAMYGQTFFHELQLLAAKGYVVLYTNPRGSHGYGQDFVDACRTDYGGSDYTDLMTAVDYALDNYDFIDKDRLGVTGGSYGGFMTNWIVGHTNRFKAAVTQRSISNWLSFYGVSDIGYFFTDWELGESRLNNPAKLWEFSPLKYVDNVETPLLIVHGEQDLRCPIEQGEQLFIALKHLKKEVEFVRFPGANHELSRSGNPAMRMERLNHICGWFERYL
ncbi:S9 family peptidase [Virgibacillus oceani]|uniref:Peptidase YuxL n=1 Tax=Virgibacillus oceani TaxID=1479511 RepID=A0A917HR93_9BACI|nr:S9 family peptidase [Virgibacillus oceani]GGG86566.1 putative peptidase YuxL [Virgibacillus oceani]